MSSDAWLRTVARRLGDLREQVVFVGGAVLGLLIDDPGAAPARATDDVDVVVEVAALADFHALEARLRRRGFAPDTSEGAPICRWIVDDVVVDLLPTSDRILGFANRWYADAVAHANRHELKPGLAIRVATAAHFVATKLEAFANRGGGDFAASHDLEDVIAIVDGRASLVHEARAMPAALREYLATRVTALLADDRFVSALPGHLGGDRASQARRPLVTDRLQQLAKLERR